MKNWEKYLNRLWHAGLLTGSLILANNPKYAWLAPLLQAFGQASLPPE